MVARDSGEEHRASTPLELFFDLCFVVAVAAASTELHHSETEPGHLAAGVVSYLMVFFAIWWAWMNVTWFASAYDPDDVLYRLSVLVVMAGALVLAAGVPRAFEERDFTVVTVGYCVMRLSLVQLWLRAAHDDPPRRDTAVRMATGVSLCQLGWVALLLVPVGLKLPGFALLVVCELVVPVVAERANPTQWHPGHISERYGLFTLIVLGESVLSGSVAIGAAVTGSGQLALVWGIAVGGLLLVFSMWWKYFARTAVALLTSTRQGFVWGYGHLVVFASAAATGAGIAVAVDQATGVADIDLRLAAACVTVPAALYLATVWWLHLRPQEGTDSRSFTLLGVGLVLLATFGPQPVLLAGLAAALTVAANVVLDVRASTTTRAAAPESA
ncbi:MAG: low temperature requirement protein A [Frankiales bacterium]|nr:low temperature requirement protein A [Frankiales bacterium]